MKYKVRDYPYASLLHEERRSGEAGALMRGEDLEVVVRTLGPGGEEITGLRWHQSRFTKAQGENTSMSINA